MNRREFIKSVAGAAAVVALPQAVSGEGFRPGNLTMMVADTSPKGLTTSEVLDRIMGFPDRLRGQYRNSFGISFGNQGYYGGEILGSETIPGTDIIKTIFVRWHGLCGIEVRDIKDIRARMANGETHRYVQYLPNQWRWVPGSGPGVVVGVDRHGNLTTKNIGRVPVA